MPPSIFLFSRAANAASATELPLAFKLGVPIAAFEAPTPEDAADDPHVEELSELLAPPGFDEGSSDSCSLDRGVSIFFRELMLFVHLSMSSRT